VGRVGRGKGDSQDWELWMGRRGWEGGDGLVPRGFTEGSAEL